MIYITYIKNTGEIVAPIIQGKTEQNFKDVFGDKAELFNLIYDSINISCNNENEEMQLFKDIKNFYIDINTKTLIRKKTENININYAPKKVIKNE